MSPRGILAPQFAASARRAGGGDVIVAHDTTNFMFRRKAKREGLGRFKNGPTLEDRRSGRELTR